MRSITALSILLGIALLAVSAIGQRSTSDEGIELYRAGNFTEALTRLTEATAADRDDSEAWRYLAATYQHLGNEKEAIKALKTSRNIKRAPPPKYDQPAKITSKHTAGIKGTDSGPPWDYTVAVELRSDGTVGIIIPYMISFVERKQAIIDEAKKIKFEPAMQNGKPVTMIRVIEYTFSSY